MAEDGGDARQVLVSLLLRSETKGAIHEAGDEVMDGAGRGRPWVAGHGAGLSAGERMKLYPNRDSEDRPLSPACSIDTSRYNRSVDRLSRTDILRALAALADEIQAVSGANELVVVGGAAMVLLYGARESTKDVDALIISPGGAEEVRAGARRVGESLGLPDDWLNDAAKGYVHGLALGEVILETPALRVRTLAPHQLLAMKLSAWRDDVDIDDARLLLSKLSGDRDAIWHLIEPHLVPGRELKASYAFADLWEVVHGAT
jgi:hypothetical protein